LYVIGADVHLVSQALPKYSAGGSRVCFLNLISRVLLSLVTTPLATIPARIWLTTVCLRMALRNSLNAPYPHWRTNSNKLIAIELAVYLKLRHLGDQLSTSASDNAKNPARRHPAPTPALNQCLQYVKLRI